MLSHETIPEMAKEAFAARVTSWEAGPQYTMSTATVYNRKLHPREFNFPPLKAYTKTTRHVISYGSSHSSQFGGYKLDDTNTKTVFWPTNSAKTNTEENATRPRQKSHTPSQKAPSSQGAEQDDRCQLHAVVTQKKQKTRRSIKQLKRKHSTGKRKSKEANGEKCKKAVKAYVPITAPKSVSVPVDGQSSAVGTQTIPMPSPSPYKAKSASLMPNRSARSHFQTTLWKEGSCWPKASPEVGSFHNNAPTATHAPVLRDKADRRHRQVGRCEAVEILDKTIDSLTVTDKNVMDSVENGYDGRSSKASSGATNGSRSFPRPIDRFPPQPKQIRNFTFRTLTRPQAAVVGSSVSGLIADKKYSALRGLLQSRGALPKAPAPSAASYHRVRSLSSRDDDDVTSSVSYNFRYQKRQQEQFQRARTWTESVTGLESVWTNEWQTVSSLVSSMPSRMSDGTYHDVTSIVDLPDIVATRTESRAATRGSVMSSRDALHLSVELEEDVNDVFSEGGEPALSAASYPQPWDEADDASLHQTDSELGQTKLDNGVNQDTLAIGAKQLKSKPKTALKSDTLLSYSGEEFERYKASVDDDSMPPEVDQCNGNEQNKPEDIDDEVFHGTHIYHDPRVQSSIDVLYRNKVTRSTRPKSILKSKSAKFERNVRKDVYDDADEDSQYDGRRPEFGRSYTAVCMGTSSFEPINRRYSTRSSQSQRNKVMFAADDYVGYQHKKFSKAVNSKQVTPDRNYDEKTKVEFLNVKIGETPEQADSQLSQDSSDYLSDSYDSG